MVGFRRNHRNSFDLSDSYRDVKGALVSVADRNEDTSRNGRFVAVELEESARPKAGSSVAGTTAADGRTGADRTMSTIVVRTTEIRHDDCRSKEAGQGRMCGNSDSNSCKTGRDQPIRL